MGLFGFGKKEKDKMKDGLEKTRTGFWGNIMNTLTGSKIDDDLYDELEEQLILADVGGEVAIKLVDKLRDRVNEKGLKTGEQASDELRDLIADEMRPEAEMDLSGRPAVILVIGVNGVGKTTSIGKIAHRLKGEGKRVLLCAADTFRAAAADQLEIWANRAECEIVRSKEGADPGAVLFDSLAAAKARNVDVVFCDTAGRLHIDESMMDEIAAVKQAVNPAETLLVVDAMTGQDAVNVASSFNEKLGITGVILTKLDGDTRGGAALSVRSVTGKPIKFSGIGEKLTDIEPFYPDRMASRILGMGDVLTLIEKAEQAFDEKQAEELTKKIKNDKFTLEDFLEQFQQVKKLGSMEEILGMMPGVDASKLKDAKIDQKATARVEAIIRSMTPRERRNPELLNASRKKRIAAGSGTTVQEVNRLLKQFEQSRQLMKRFAGMGRKKSGRRKGFFGF